MTSDAVKTSKPWPIIIMLGMLALVIGLGLVLSPKTEEGKLWWIDFLGTTNHGILLNPPLEFAQGDLLSEDGSPWEGFLEPTFKLVVMNRGNCDQRCRDMLESTRQLHVRLNRDYADVSRGFLHLDLPVHDARTLTAHLPDYELLKLGRQDLLELFATTNMPALSEGPVLGMISPLNIMMMAYTSDHSGSEVLEDLEHLLELAR